MNGTSIGPYFPPPPSPIPSVGKTPCQGGEQIEKACVWWFSMILIKAVEQTSINSSSSFSVSNKNPGVYWQIIAKNKNHKYA